MTEEIYRKLYVYMMHESERALQILIQAQQDCEERLLEAEEKDEKDDRQK